MSDTPSISVLVNSYLRTTYLEQALYSVFRQKTNRPFEIVLISAVTQLPLFKKAASEASREGLPFQLVSVPPGPVGAGLSAGISASNGDVIAILDDDDLWEPGKIRAVEQAFEDPVVGFFHNGQRFVDANNREISRWNVHRSIRHRSSLVSQDRDVFLDSKSPDSFEELMRLEPSFNNSSISIRRAILETRLNQLSKLTGGEDSFMFLSAIAAGTWIHASSARLTRLRVHSASSTAGAGASKRFRNRVADYSRYASRHITRLRICRELLTSAPSSLGLTILDRDEARWSLVSSVFSGEARPMTRRDSTRILMDVDVLSPDLRELLAILSGGASAISRRLAQAVFVAWRMIW